LKLLLIFVFSLLCAVPLLTGQVIGIDQTSDLVVIGSNKFLRWYGHSSRTYFIQVSDPDDHLNRWAWAPIIESGNDEDISYEVDGTADKCFFRLKYTNQVPGSGETLDTADFDSDSISNIEEVTYYSTDPLNPDTDGDGLDDDYEVWYYDSDPNNPDSDGDGLNDGDEMFVYGTDPNNSDSDNDGLPDGAEVNLYGTDPSLGDTDGDDVPDASEIAHSLDPLNPTDGAGDLDLDGMPNGWEYLNALDIAVNDAFGDYDGDELANIVEYQDGTKANNFDTDGDLLPDGWELRYGLNPLNIAGDDGMDGDFELDGLKNIDELIHGSSPIAWDTDSDGTSDFQEIEQGSDPNSAIDGGQPPSAEEIALVKLTVGDSSGSHSERYKMVVKGVTGDTRTINHQATGFGVVSTKSYKLRKGAKYEVEIVHTGTDPDFLELYGFSNYDWRADIQPDDDTLLIKKDPHTILTEVVDWPNSTFQIKGKKAELFVMKFETKTIATIPFDQTRKKVGVGEKVDITVTPTGAGNITWTMSGHKDSEINASVNNYRSNFTAASEQCDPLVLASFESGETHTIKFNVVEPTEESAKKVQEFTALDMGVLDDVQGVGMRVVYKFLPADVSFVNIEMRELTCPPTNETGYFLQHPGQTHNPAGWEKLTELNTVIDLALFKEMPKINVNGSLAWIAGSSEWDIPVRWRVVGKSIEHSLPNRLQKHEITNSNGASTETKSGESCSRTPKS
jgi:hypothetical protein